MVRGSRAEYARSAHGMERRLPRRPVALRQKRRRLLAVLALAAISVLVAACGSSGGDDGAASDPTATIALTAQPSSEATSEGSTRVARDGDRVSVHYHGTLEDGEVFDSSRGGTPFQFRVGAGEAIAGFDNAVRGLAVGESVTVTIPPAEAYGERSDGLVLELPAAGAPEGLAVGDRVRLANGASALVLEISNAFITVDANHELAGLALTFEIELVSIE